MRNARNRVTIWLTFGGMDIFDLERDEVGRCEGPFTGWTTVMLCRLVRELPECSRMKFTGAVDWSRNDRESKLQASQGESYYSSRHMRTSECNSCKHQLCWHSSFQKPEDNVSPPLFLNDDPVWTLQASKQLASGKKGKKFSHCTLCKPYSIRANKGLPLRHAKATKSQPFAYEGPDVVPQSQGTDDVVTPATKPQESSSSTDSVMTTSDVQPATRTPGSNQTESTVTTPPTPWAAAAVEVTTAKAPLSAPLDAAGVELPTTVSVEIPLPAPVAAAAVEVSTAIAPLSAPLDAAAVEVPTTVSAVTPPPAPLAAAAESYRLDYHFTGDTPELIWQDYRSRIVLQHIGGPLINDMDFSIERDAQFPQQLLVSCVSLFHNDMSRRLNLDDFDEDMNNPASYTSLSQEGLTETEDVCMPISLSAAKAQLKKLQTLRESHKVRQICPVSNISFCIHAHVLPVLGKLQEGSSLQQVVVGAGSTHQ